MFGSRFLAIALYIMTIGCEGEIPEPIDNTAEMETAAQGLAVGTVRFVATETPDVVDTTSGYRQEFARWTIDADGVAPTSNKLIFRPMQAYRDDWSANVELGAVTSVVLHIADRITIHCDFNRKNYIRCQTPDKNRVSLLNGDDVWLTAIFRDSFVPQEVRFNIWRPRSYLYQWDSDDTLIIERGVHSHSEVVSIETPCELIPYQGGAYRPTILAGINQARIADFNMMAQRCNGGPRGLRFSVTNGGWALGNWDQITNINLYMDGDHQAGPAHMESDGTISMPDAQFDIPMGVVHSLELRADIGDGVDAVDSLLLQLDGEPDSHAIDTDTREPIAIHTSLVEVLQIVESPVLVVTRVDSTPTDDTHPLPIDFDLQESRLNQWCFFAVYGDVRITGVRLDDLFDGEAAMLVYAIVLRFGFGPGTGGIVGSVLPQLNGDSIFFTDFVVEEEGEWCMTASGEFFYPNLAEEGARITAGLSWIEAEAEATGLPIDVVLSDEDREADEFSLVRGHEL